MSHYDDEDQAEMVKDWWRANWKALALGVSVGLAGILGWNYYKDQQIAKASEGARLYQELKTSLIAGKIDDAKKLATQLKTDYSGSPYPDQAMLSLAQEAVEKRQYAQAAEDLKWVMDNAYDPMLRPVARLRYARVLLQLEKTDEALKLLDSADLAEFTALVEELRGDIKLFKGDRKGARSAFEKALTAAKDSPTNLETLQRKIDDLADAA